MVKQSLRKYDVNTEIIWRHRVVSHITTWNDVIVRWEGAGVRKGVRCRCSECRKIAG